jgi:GNAT superfamily N-acetyltransferase
VSSSRVKVLPVAPDELAEPLRLLEEFLRGGDPLSPAFSEQLSLFIKRGDLEVLAARVEGRLVGVAVLTFRCSVSSGGLFASIEDLYVRPEARRRGVGRMLIHAVEERCRERDISYIEVQTDDEATPFYEALGYKEEGVRVLSRSYAL